MKNFKKIRRLWRARAESFFGGFPVSRYFPSSRSNHFLRSITREKATRTKANSTGIRQQYHWHQHQHNIIGLSISSRITIVSSSLSPTIEFIAISGIIQGTVFALLFLETQHQDDSSRIYLLFRPVSLIMIPIAQQPTTRSVQYPPSHTLIEQYRMDGDSPVK